MEDTKKLQQEIEERKQAEEELRVKSSLILLLKTGAVAANEANDVEEAFQIVLDEVCKFTGWPIGHVYMPAQDGPEELVSSPVWHLEDPERFEKFVKVTEETSFSSGFGMPGRVQASTRPEWINDVTKATNFLRTQQTKDIGVKAAFAFPVLVGSEVVAVLEFFATEATEPDPEFLEVMGDLGTQLGRVVERKQAEEELQISEEKFSKAFHTSPDAIVITRLTDGRLLDANEGFERIMGYSRAEALGKTTSHFNMWLNPDDRVKWIDALKQDGRAEEMEVTLRNKAGEERNCLITAETIEVARELCIVTTVRDITDRKRAEQEKEMLEARLLQAQKMEAVGTLAGGIAHDFNNILGAIIGYTEISIDQVTSGEMPERRNLEQVLNASMRAKELVKQILAFSRRSEVEKSCVRIGGIVREALKLLRGALPSTIEIRQSIEDTADDMALADPTQIHQVVMNLCTNAWQAMHDTGGVLSVELESVQLDSDSTVLGPELAPGPYLKLTVGDTGAGIAEEALDRIFEPFFTTKKRGGGTGMGLAVVHGIMRSHGGNISVRSEVGKGSVFEILLPRIENHGESLEEPLSELPRGTERILIVDDEYAIIDVECRILESLGYEVVARQSGAEAIEAFSDEPDGFDLVITDFTMPKMTGLEMAERLFEVRPGIPILLCTGYSDTITPEKAVEIGFREMVMKPLGKRELAETVRRALDES